MRLYRVDDAVHLLCLLTDGKSADGVTVEVKLCDLVHMLNSKILIRSALIYTEEHLIFVYRFGKRVSLSISFLQRTSQRAVRSQDSFTYL